MDVSPKTLREVEFREKMRGYHPEDVDQFLERVAAGIEVLQDRLRQANDRAQRAEQAANEVGGSDETLRRTLVLAQRTADLAVQEAREQAARILADADQQAKSTIGEADDRARRAHDDAMVEVKGELSKLEASRQQLQADVDNLNRWVTEHRAHLKGHMHEAMAQIDQADLLATPPTSRPLDISMAGPVGAAPASPAVVPNSPAAVPTPAAQADERPPVTADDAELPSTMAWQPGEDAGPTEEPSGEVDPYFAQLRRAAHDPDSPDLRPPPPEGDALPGPRLHDQDAELPDPDSPGTDFFDQDSFAQDFDEAPRFGGRLRRRRGG